MPARVRIIAFVTRGQTHRLGVIVGVLVVVLGGVYLRNGVARNLLPKRFGVVQVDRIYRSGAPGAAATRHVVERRGIRTILDLGAYEPGSPGEHLARETAESLHVLRLRLDLKGDATGNPNWYVRALEVMTDPKRQPVLVHCGAGSERTGAAVALYRYVVQGVPIDRAYEETRRYGHSGRRNPHLREVLDTWGDPIARAYRAGTLIPGVEPVPTLEEVAGSENPGAQQGRGS